MIIPNKIYRAIVQGLSNTTDGKYYVYIPTLMSHDSGFHGCMAKNKVSSYAKWMDPTTKEIKSIGVFIPLQVGMMVEVKFDTEQFDSCNIVDLVYDQSPGGKDDQEQFYIFGKSVNNTMIYTDESRNLTHIMHHNGTTNVLMFDDKISLSVNETSNAGTNNLSNVEIGAESITLKVGNTSLILDESGMKIATKNNKWEFGNKEMNYKTEKYTIEADSFEVSAKKVFINGVEENHIKGNVTRLTGTQQLAVNGNTVSVDSNINTTINSSGFTTLSATTALMVDCPAYVNVNTNGVLGLNGTLTYLGGNTLTMDGEMVAINGATVSMDGTILTNLNVATAQASSIKASILAMDATMTGVNTGWTTAFHFGDVGTGMASNIMTEKIPGVAQGAPNPTVIPTIVPKFDYINTTLKYIHTTNSVSNVGTIDNLNSLNGNILPSMFLKS